MNTRQFIFLYPISQIIEYRIENHGWREEGGIEAFRHKCKILLNKCIDIRYRQKDFSINYAIFDDVPISEIIELQKSDKIIKVGLNYKEHTTKQPNGEYPYPNQDCILNQLGVIKTIRIAGFHMWDCVERLAKKAYERGVDTLVDEDLTEFFFWGIRHSDFMVDMFPSYNPREEGGDIGFEFFMKARRERPWLWQNY